MSPIAQKIRELLDERGWSVLRLSREIEQVAGGLSSTWNVQLGRWLNHDVWPERKAAEALAAVFDVHVDEFVPAAITAAGLRRLQEQLDAATGSANAAQSAAVEVRAARRRAQAIRRQDGPPDDQGRRTGR